jgi:Phosphodiester glycosidase
MPVNIVNNTTSIKRRDNITPIEIELLDEKNTAYAVDGKTVYAWFSNESGYLFEKQITELSGNKVTIRIETSDIDKIGVGLIRMEIVVMEGDKQKIFPNGDYIEFTIMRNLKSVKGEVVPVIEFTYFEQQFDSLKIKTEEAADRANKAADSVENLAPQIEETKQASADAKQAAADAEAQVAGLTTGADGTQYDSATDRFKEEFNFLETGIEDTVFYEEITHEEFYDEQSKTVYYITTVPHLDKKGNIIKLQKEFQNDEMNSGSGETPRAFVNRSAASLATNASIWDTTTQGIKGVQIKDGQVYQDRDGGASYVLGVKEDNTLVMYDPSVTAEQMINEGIKNTFTAFFPMIDDGKPVGSEVWGIIGNTTTTNPRNVIAQMPNKDIIFLTCEGRLTDNVGMTYDDCIRILAAMGVTTAYCLDGGGSAQTVHNNILINQPIDSGFKQERAVSDFIYFKKPTLKKREPIEVMVGEMAKQLKDIGIDLGNTIGSNGGSVNGVMNFLKNVYIRTYMYMNNNSAIYSYTSAGTLNRLLGIQSDDIFRIGTNQVPMAFYTSKQPTMLVGSALHTVATTPNVADFTNAVMENGWTTIEGREVRYRKILNKMVILEGYAVGGTSGTTGDSSSMFTLPAAFRPSRQKVYNVPVLGSTETNNRVVIYPNGRVTCSFPFSSGAAGAGVQLDIMYFLD